MPRAPGSAPLPHGHPHGRFRAARWSLLGALAGLGCSPDALTTDERAISENQPKPVASADARDAGELPGEPSAGLRVAASRAGKLIGVAVQAAALERDATYAEVVSREFGYLTPENAAKWGSLEPARGAYAWGDLDAIVDFARSHDQVVKGHTFVWHQQTPSWVTESMSADDLRDALRGHVQATLDRYRGRIRAWDVVNEAVDTSTESGYTDSIFYRKLGPGYIEDAFRWAREADPDALLFYNEVGIERIGEKSNFTHALMQDLLDRGVPIDGIGLQSHASSHRYPPLSNLRANVRRFADLGLIVNVSEADVRTRLMPGDEASRHQAQRIAYQQIVGACTVEPACEGVTLWGVADPYSWISEDEALVFDASFAPKPAYQGVIDGLAGLLPALGDNLVVDGDFSTSSGAWSALDARVVVSEADDREGLAACTTARTDEASALVQAGLLDALETGGPHALSAWVRLSGAPDASVTASFVVAEEGAAEPRRLNVAGVPAHDSEWTELAGYFGLGFEATPTAIELQLSGPPAGVDLCVADVRVQRLSAR